MTTPGRGRGRPPRLSPEQRHDLILGAAADVFAETGYAAAAMDEIARRAGMSKKTLYALYAGKEALFAAMVEARVERLFSAVPADACAGPPAVALTGLLGRLAEAICDGQSLCLLRVVVAETGAHPELGRIFLAAGPTRVRTAVADFLRRQQEAGLLRPHDPDLVARLLLDMALGNPLFRLLDPDGQTSAAAEIARRIPATVEIFISGLAASPPPTAPPLAPGAATGTAGPAPADRR
ncbi:TetR/AcrR family transcriptional regulator [Methylobrevis pamukkalensis]|uniref:Bacterial regulatory protein, tetR family n=1 Tax=Methylobrevis pamukkalensis TaxID=1439726 RepID=A0A1E3H7I0_9HYPH|nr:TetR/AcrR family transcriptional regulator [Methylobrevis pamukkalensis]ODN72287.1 Bacterial regulatory protein, tetR family [Methylobrevis pamukkalensis]